MQIIMISLLPLFMIFWVNSSLKAGLVLLWVSIILSMMIQSSLSVYLIVLVYISGVLVLMLYFSILLSNTLTSSTFYWILVLTLPFFSYVFEETLSNFEFHTLLMNLYGFPLLVILMMFVFILIIISMIFISPKTIRLT